jgi:hypothetical protein
VQQVGEEIHGLLGDIREVLTLQLDPYCVAPLGPDPVSLAALGARAYLERTGKTERDLAAVAARGAWMRLGLMPRINRLSDAAQAGDAQAKRRFDAAHRLSVMLNGVQMLVAVGVLLRFV